MTTTDASTFPPPGGLPRVGVSILATQGDRVLLGQRMKEPNRGLWVLPGGKVEPYESAERAALREFREEVGVSVELGRIIAVAEIIRPNQEHRIILTFAAELDSPEEEIRGGDDLGSPALFTREQLHSLAISNAVRPVLESAGWLDTGSPAGQGRGVDCQCHLLNRRAFVGEGPNIFHLPNNLATFNA